MSLNWKSGPAKTGPAGPSSTPMQKAFILILKYCPVVWLENSVADSIDKFYSYALHTKRAGRKAGRSPCMQEVSTHAFKWIPSRKVTGVGLQIYDAVF